MYVWLRLKLLADAGLVGMPNAGKSTFINQVSNTKAKVGDYPFTTTRPQLGVVDHKSREFVLADIPGLIAGAAEGVGIGDRSSDHRNHRPDLARARRFQRRVLGQAHVGRACRSTLTCRLRDTSSRMRVHVWKRMPSHTAALTMLRFPFPLQPIRDSSCTPSHPSTDRIRNAVRF
jgi:hypothetical protein